MQVQLMDKELVKSLVETVTAERVARQSEALTRARDVAGALYDEALGIALDHGTRSEGAVAAILATLTTAYFKELE